MALVGDIITKGFWTCTLTLANDRGPAYLLQGQFTYAGQPWALIETHDLVRAPSDAAIQAKVIQRIDEFEQTRLMLTWAKVNLVGASRLDGPWAVTVNTVEIDVPRREIELKLTVSKAGLQSRQFRYDLQTRTRTLAAVRNEVDEWLRIIKERVAAKVVPLSEDEALGQVN